jgi:hypothetical protein
VVQNIVTENTTVTDTDEVVAMVANLRPQRALDGDDGGVGEGGGIGECGYNEEGSGHGRGPGDGKAGYGEAWHDEETYAAGRPLHKVCHFSFLCLLQLIPVPV